jgi:hypothetical protein
MKNHYLFFILLFVTLTSNAQIVDIPDTNFKNALLNHDPIIDTNNDGEIQESEAESVTVMYVADKNISSLEGIQSFILLELLSCYNNQLATINLSNNSALRILECYNNNLLNLDLSLNIELQLLHLQYLHCYRNLLTNLNIGSNLYIKVISTSFNDLVDLDISQCPNLEFLFCNNNNLVNLNTQNNNNSFLISMISFDNPNLICIQVDDVENSENRDCELQNNMGWCKDNWTEYSELCELGIEDNLQSQFVIFPNPANGVIRIETDYSINSIKVFNTSGQLVLEQNNSSNQIDVSHLSRGLLFVKIETDYGSLVKKVIKE